MCIVLLDGFIPFLIEILFPASEIQTGILGEIDCTRFSHILFGSNLGDLNQDNSIIRRFLLLSVNVWILLIS